MGVKKKRDNFNTIVSLMEEKERTFSLYFLISTLILVVLISVALMMDSKEANCPYLPRKIQIYIELPNLGANAPNGIEPAPVTEQIEVIFQILRRAEIPGFLLDWSHNFSSGVAKELDTLTWSLVEFKDTKSSILKDNSISLRTLSIDGTKETQQVLCEESDMRCPPNYQIDLQKPLIANLDVFDTPPIFQRCLKQSGKTDAVSTLSNVIRTFPRGIHPEFFANSNTALETVHRFRSRSLKLGDIKSDFSGQQFTLTVTEVSDSIEGSKRESSDPQSPILSPRYLLAVSGKMGDPFTTEADHSLRSLRHFFEKLLIQGKLLSPSAVSDSIQEQRMKNFKRLIGHNPLI